MTTNNNGNLLDTAGEISIDFVWGNMAPQPNDVRSTRLDLTLSDHINLTTGWGGFPLFTADSPGSDVVGSTDYVKVPSIIGLTEASATDAIRDAGLVKGTVTTTSTGANADNDGLVKTQSVAANAAEISVGRPVNFVLYEFIV